MPAASSSTSMTGIWLGAGAKHHSMAGAIGARVAGAGFAVAATLRGAGINVMVVEQSGKVGAS
jgi:hypothetical protein